MNSLPPFAYGNETLILVHVHRVIFPVTSDRPIYQRQYNHLPHNRSRPGDDCLQVGPVVRTVDQRQRHTIQQQQLGDCQLNI